MESVPRYVPFLPSLGHLCQLTIAQKLLITNLPPHDTYPTIVQQKEAFLTELDRVKGLVTRLNLPNKLQSEISDCVVKTGNHINQDVLHVLSVRIECSIMDILSRPSQNLGVGTSIDFCCLSFDIYGVIDPLSVAKFVINDGRWPIESQFKLACMYCMENEILRLWSLLPQNIKDGIYTNCFNYELWGDISHYWMRQIATPHLNDDGNNTSLIYSLFDTGNLVGLKFFLSTLSEDMGIKVLCDELRYNLWIHGVLGKSDYRLRYTLFVISELLKRDDFLKYLIEGRGAAYHWCEILLTDSLQSDAAFSLFETLLASAFLIVPQFVLQLYGNFKTELQSYLEQNGVQCSKILKAFDRFLPEEDEL